MSTTKTYLLVPHHDYPAGGPIVLGSIISDPLDPGDSLNQDNRVYILPNTIYTGHKTNWEHTIEHIEDGRVGVWAQCVNILGLGGGIGASFDMKTYDHYKFDDLETTYFYPRQAYVEEAVKRRRYIWLQVSRLFEVLALR
jgi:hypothetical protein